MGPSIADRLFAEPLMKLIQGHREPLRSIPSALVLPRSVVEERPLLSKAGQFCETQPHQP
jgi:hypothetical protein